MRTGKWYKVYYRILTVTSSKNRTLTVYAFSFASAAATCRIKLEQKGIDTEKILFTRIDLISQ